MSTEEILLTTERNKYYLQEKYFPEIKEIIIARRRNTSDNPKEVIIGRKRNTSHT